MLRGKNKAGVLCTFCQIYVYLYTCKLVYIWQPSGSHSILARWRNHFSKILNIHGVNDVRQIELHTAEPLVPEPSVFEFDSTIEKINSHKAPGINQIPAELIKAGWRTVRYEIHKLIISVWRKEELPEEWKESIIVPIYKKGDKTDCSSYRGISLLLTPYKIYQTSCCHG